MRIDKFLKVSRIIKRRQIAKEACEAGRVSINNNIAKAGSNVSVGDKVSVIFGNRTVEFEILNLNEKASKKDAESLYKIL